MDYKSTPKGTINVRNATEVIVWALEWDADHPVSGVLLHNNAYAYFQLCGEEDGKRHYSVHRLPPEQWSDINRWHGEFTSRVGNHMDYTYGENNLRRRQAEGCIHPASSHQTYFDLYNARNPKYDYGKNEIIGWFEL